MNTISADDILALVEFAETMLDEVPDTNRDHPDFIEFSQLVDRVRAAMEFGLQEAEDE